MIIWVAGLSVLHNVLWSCPSVGDTCCIVSSSVCLSFDSYLQGEQQQSQRKQTGAPEMYTLLRLLRPSVSFLTPASLALPRLKVSKSLGWWCWGAASGIHAKVWKWFAAAPQLIIHKSDVWLTKTFLCRRFAHDSNAINFLLPGTQVTCLYRKGT